jgi:epoxyqueuosine reductase
MTHCTTDYNQLALDIKRWGQELGFQQVGISDVNLKEAEGHLNRWLKNNYHGKMSYMELHGSKRSRPHELLPETLRIISVRMNYLPMETSLLETLRDQQKAYISRYALGRDYHKFVKKRLLALAKKINEAINHFHYRTFVDSAPVLEKAIAEKAGLGWIGKNTLIINKAAGSWFFLGEIYANIPLPVDSPSSNHCGSCTACLDICPTKAFVGPYQLDARRCISYLTIELKTAIPLELRPLIGNRIFGCDDCQIVCPWNKFARYTTEDDFKPRANLATASLIDLFSWSEDQFNKLTEGSAIRRTGYEGWLRNIAVALGNAPTTPEVIDALKQRLLHPSSLVREHVEWALSHHRSAG